LQEEEKGISGTQEKKQENRIKMPSITKTLGAVVAGLAAFASAAPGAPKLTRSQMKIHEVMKRQNQLAAAAGLTDLDILQLCVTPYPPPLNRP
jgi:hypothetical protein